MMDPECPDPRLALSAEIRKQFRVHGGVTREAIADALANVAAPIVMAHAPAQDAAERPTAPAESPRTSGGSDGDLRATAIEAAFQALEANGVVAKLTGDSWMVEVLAAERAAIIAAAYDAMAPHIRRQVAEEIADAIEAECIDPDWPNDDISVNGARAAAIAREIGAS